MQLGLAPLSLGFIIALVVIIVAILGLIGVVPWTPEVGFAMLGAIAAARLC